MPIGRIELEDAVGTVPNGDIRLWIPGLGDTDRKVRAVAKAVRDYDESLRLARHEVYGDWVIIIGEQGHPVFGFGQELPDPNDVARILGEHDMARNGKRIMAELARAAELRRQEELYKVSEKDGELAEWFESGFRRQGKHPIPRIFVPKGVD